MTHAISREYQQSYIHPKCKIPTRRHKAKTVRRGGDRNGPIYDASDIRVAGKPCACILGTNDVPKGADLGTHDMSPGKVRELTIPPELGYRSGSKLYRQIPPNTKKLEC